ncbi:glycoside hydrolase [Pseudomonas agarici]|uniref:Glycoside hydrolase n=1 Tax=Pseudomonas agarici TaxID=46677 RepID=A0A0X1T898_PSEAA|nr:glycoside hydrolase [Pseudomonas agarici]NWB90058.1 glycosyltransferase [Pseudomonas agarici]NWC08164.1 glycosyltransferase [Pseudomonas agarici]
MIIYLYEAYLARRGRRRTLGLKTWLLDKFRALKSRGLQHVENRLVSTFSYRGLFLIGIEVLIVLLLLLLLSPLAVLWGIGLGITAGARRLKRVLGAIGSTSTASRWYSMVNRPKGDAFVLRLYKRLEWAEAERMQHLIERMDEVRAWYCPTAFWPAFNNIATPRLMCVPDVVLADFSVGFSNVGENRFLQVFEQIGSSIRSATNLVCYSETVKWATLVDRYAIAPSAITVIRHAPNDLSSLVTVHGFSDGELASRNYCEKLLIRAFKKSSNFSYAAGFANAQVKFIFYASQFRPNKNVLTLLTAYEYLLRRRFITHKLLLTGNIDGYPQIREFIKEHFLENDVICLHGLSIQELAACYKLADLAVNPSLSEGGCPFTLTEALSVSTPVVMARTAVSEEIIQDPQIYKVTLFDPYDWRDMARCIEWGLTHREQLLEIQKKFYEVLSRRTWADVANEHIEILDRISGGPCG